MLLSTPFVVFVWFSFWAFVFWKSVALVIFGFETCSLFGFAA